MIGPLLSLLGRDRAWRLGRALYMRARGEKSTNAISQNGEAALILRVIASADPQRTPILLDVGANLGEWTESALAEARAAARGIKVHVFEPTPVAAERLQRLFADRMEAVVHSIALSDRSGTAQFAVYGETAGTNSLELQSDLVPLYTVDVPTMTGADFAARHGLGSIDLLKIDTEGHDFRVLQGFEPLFEQGAIGAAQFEYNSRWLSAHLSLRDLFQLAGRTGYRLGLVAPDRIELFDRWNPECDRFFEDNYVLVHPSRAQALAAVEMRWSVSNTLVPASS